MKSITVSLVSLLAGQANAWWGTGHLLTARIAYDRLIALDREDVIELVETELSVLDSFVHIEKNHPFVEAATFADWIKNAGWLTTEDWHFIDTPIFDEGFSKEVTSDKHNVEWVIDLLRKQIIDPIGKQWWPNTQPFPPVDPSLSRSFNIRMLIHFIGDMH
jgi:hypothetical protein